MKAAAKQMISNSATAAPIDICIVCVHFSLLNPHAGTATGTANGAQKSGIRICTHCNKKMLFK
jgi:hypothetical protein